MNRKSSARLKKMFKNMRIPFEEENNLSESPVDDEDLTFRKNERHPSPVDYGSDDSVADKDFIPDSNENSSESDQHQEFTARERVKKNLLPIFEDINHNSELIQLTDLINNPEENSSFSAEKEYFETAAATTTAEFHVLPEQATPVRSNSQITTAVFASPCEFVEVVNRPVNDSEIKKRPTKRKRNEELWKRTVAKQKRLTGSAYKSDVARKKKYVPKKALKSSCACKMKCSEKISTEQRQRIFQHFWRSCSSWDQRRQFVAGFVDKNIKARQKTNAQLETDRRKFTYTYHLGIDFDRRRVCQVMFLNTLSIGKKFVRISLEKVLDTGIVQEDRRGRHVPGNKLPDLIKDSVRQHISSFPVYESHYSRQRSQKKYLGPELSIRSMYKIYKEQMEAANVDIKQIAKEWLYRLIFKTEFNLSFKLPGIDTCDDCDRFARQLLDCACEEEKKKVVEEKEKHLQEADKRYKMKDQDKKEATESNGKRVLTLDLQKCLPTPNLTNNQSFYLRKLWTLNLTIYDTTTKKTSNYVWPENYGGRGGNEIASCIIKWAEENLDETVTEITIYSDNCTGQNRNSIIVLAYVWIMDKFPNIRTINHKFLLKGHTHMEVDHAHSLIERKKRKLNTIELATPRDWAQFIRSCEGKNPFSVTEMSIEDFKNVAQLAKKGGLIFRKKNSEKQDFKISQTVWWQLRRDKVAVLHYKTNFDSIFSELSLIRNTKTNLNLPDLQVMRTTEKPISTAKYHDLMTLLKWIPKSCHHFYQSLVHSDTASDVPEADRDER